MKLILVIFVAFAQSACTMEPLLIIYNNSGAKVHISIANYKGITSNYEIDKSSVVEITNWSLYDPEMMIGNHSYQYKIEIPRTAVGWKGWWLFAYSYINCQIEEDGSIVVLNKKAKLPIEQEKDIMFIIKPNKNT